MTLKPLKEKKVGEKGRKRKHGIREKEVESVIKLRK